MVAVALPPTCARLELKEMTGPVALEVRDSAMGHASREDTSTMKFPVGWKVRLCIPVPWVVSSCRGLAAACEYALVRQSCFLERMLVIDLDH